MNSRSVNGLGSLGTEADAAGPGPGTGARERWEFPTFELARSGERTEGFSPDLAETLAKALAVFAVDLIEVLPVRDREAALERLANRLDDRGRGADGAAAALLGAVGGALMRVGC